MDMRQFDEDHIVILEQIEQLDDLLQVPTHSTELVCTKLRRLGTKVRLHLAIEDAFLYPRLIESRCGQTSSMARSFQREMGGLSAVLEALLDRYASQADIGRDPSRFVQDCAQMLAALRARIAREDAELYPLAGEV